MGPEDVDAAVRLVADEYWNKDASTGALTTAHLHSQAWVGAKDDSDCVVATARATSDHSRHAWILMSLLTAKVAVKASVAL
ncbi:MAG: hypothetical protein R3C68_10910 [Myxococcota bacterium]